MDPGPISWRLLLDCHKMAEGQRGGGSLCGVTPPAIHLRRWTNPSASSPSRTDAEQRPAREHVARPVEERTWSTGVGADNILGRCKFEVIAAGTQRCYQSPTSGSGISTAPVNSMLAAHYSRRLKMEPYHQLDRGNGCRGSPPALGWPGETIRSSWSSTTRLGHMNAPQSRTGVALQLV